MEKFFNTAGPTKFDLNYYISTFVRIDWEDLSMLIDSQRYFLLHAPRQTGKTTALLEIMARLNSEDKYNCLYANIETAQTARNEVKSGISAVCDSIARHAQIYLEDTTLENWLAENKQKIDHNELLTKLLTFWTMKSNKPTIIFLDEIDALVGDTLISVLRQLRSGYNSRPKAFPHSLILCGLRDIRDYRIHTKDKEIITGGSAFNIKAASIRLGNFTFDECKDLYLQHTTETGQIFEQGIYEKLWNDTKGQPWLVNALAYELTWQEKELRDRTKTISVEHYNQARENLIYSRATHLDQLVDKLSEPRVKHVIEQMLNGDAELQTFKPSDIEYIIDLGLITRTREGKLEISNDIYKETIPRELTWGIQSTISNQEQHWYIKEDNSIDMLKLLRAFQQFFRENADSWIEHLDYKEAGPQLLLQAFLQRLINGGGRIDREYGLGRKRTDIIIQWPLEGDKGFLGSVQRIVIETRILYSNLDKTIAAGLEQTSQYSDLVAASESHLIIFNRSKKVLWDDKIWQKTMQYEQRKLHPS